MGLFISFSAMTYVKVTTKNVAAKDIELDFVQIKDSIKEELNLVEGAIDTTALILSYSMDRPLEEIRSRVVLGTPSINKFERVFWLNEADIYKPQNAVTLYSNITNEDPYMRESRDFTLTNLRKVLYKIPDVKNRSVLINDTVLRPDFQAYEGSADTSQVNAAFQPLIFVQNVYSGDKKLGRVIAITNIPRFLDKEWVNSHTGLVGLNLSFHSDIHAQKAYTFKRLGVSDYLQLSRSFEFVGADHRWRAQLVVGQIGHIALLAQRLPLGILFIGLFLTVVSVFYIYSNQGHSRKAETAFDALEQKNYELGIEVSERERLNQVLQKAEKEYRTLINTVNEVIFEIDIDGNVVFLNETWERLTGFSVANTLERNFFDLILPEDQEREIIAFKGLMRGAGAMEHDGHSSSYRSTTKLRTADGLYRTVELSLSILYPEFETDAILFVGTLADIEARKRAETALSEAEEKYRDIVQNAVAGFFQITPLGNILSANPAFVKILGFEAADTMLNTVDNVNEYLFKNEADKAQFFRALGHHGVVESYETQITNHKGDQLWVQLNARAIKDGTGEIKYFEGSMEDITRRKTTEVKLKEAMVLSDMANKAKSDFLSNMSHELRTPLNSIIGFAEIIKDEVLGPIENRQYWEYSRDIHESGSRLLRIINEILDIARIDAGERQLNEAKVDVNEIIETIMQLTLTKPDAQNLTVVNLCENKLPMVVGEELAIKQVLMNLMSNATKFTHDGGRVTISHELDNDGRLHISITDTGIGLDDVELEKALSPFGQADDSLKRTGTGTGLGLTLVQTLMDLHGGEFELVSQKNIGTTATISLPAKRVVIAAEEGRAAKTEEVVAQKKDLTDPGEIRFAQNDGLNEPATSASDKPKTIN